MIQRLRSRMITRAAMRGAFLLLLAAHVGAERSAAPVTASWTGFQGIGDTGAIVPTPSIAVGPSHIVETVESRIALFGRDGTMQFTQDLNGFFPAAVGQITDSRCRYDTHSGRFIVMGFDFASELSTSYMYLNIAISDDNDPSGNWYKYRLAQDIEAILYDSDLSVDANAIYVTATVFSFFSFSYYQSYYVLHKAPLLTGDAPVQRILYTGGYQPVRAADLIGSSTVAYFAALPTTSSFQVQAIVDPLGTPSLVTVDLPVPLFASATPIPNMGGTDLTTSTFLKTAAWRNGRLYAAHAIGVGSQTAIKWYEIDTGSWPSAGSPVLSNSGVIQASPGVHTFLPALVPNGNDELGFVMALSSSSEHAGIYYTGRHAREPPGATNPFKVLHVGTSGYADNDWGARFSVAVDPIDGLTVWGVGEYASAPDRWETWIGNFRGVERVYVDWRNSAGIENGGPGHPFNTITEGVLSVPYDGSVICAEGTYDEPPLAVQSRMRLVSSGGTVRVR